MTRVTLEQSLSDLRGGAAAVSPGIGYPEPGMASIALLFANGARLEAEYWRLVIDGKAGISSFDHQQKYGLPAPIDAINRLRETLLGKLVTNASLDHKTGDLFFEFAGNTSLQVFNFTGYEIWHIRFSDGTGEYSNYAK
jgi:hypothetical protein